MCYYNVLGKKMCVLRKGRRSTACEDGRLRLVEVELFSQHGHHTRYLFLLAKTRVLWPGLEGGGHLVVDPCEDLHDLKLLAKLIKNVTEGLDKPGPSTRIPPGVVTCENKCGRMLKRTGIDNILTLGWVSTQIFRFTTSWFDSNLF